MSAEPHKKPRGNPETLKRRALGGKWLKDMREAAGLTQREIAKLAGIKYWTFVSQLEIGEARLPPERYRVRAEISGSEVMANATGRPIAPLVLSSAERAYLERQVRRHRVARSFSERCRVILRCADGVQIRRE